VRLMSALPPKADIRQRSGWNEFQALERTPRLEFSSGRPSGAPPASTMYPAHPPA
jgi:hypothetical protein